MHINCYLSLWSGPNFFKRWYALQHYLLCWIAAKKNTGHMLCDAAISCTKAYRSTLSEKKVCNMSWIIYSQYNKIFHFLIILSSLVDNIQHYRPWQWCLSSNICLYEMFYPSEAYREYRQFGLVPNILGKWHSIIKLLTLFSHSIILTCPKCIFDQKRSILLTSSKVQSPSTA